MDIFDNIILYDCPRGVDLYVYHLYIENIYLNLTLKNLKIFDTKEF